MKLINSSRYFRIGELRVIQLLLGVDITNATSNTILVTAPDGGQFTVAHGNVTVDDAGTGQISWTPTSGGANDLDEAGEWFMRVTSVGGTIGTYISDVVSINVELATLPAP